MADVLIGVGLGVLILAVVSVVMAFGWDGTIYTSETREIRRG